MMKKAEGKEEVQRKGKFKIMSRRKLKEEKRLKNLKSGTIGCAGTRKASDPSEKSNRKMLK